MKTFIFTLLLSLTFTSFANTFLEEGFNTNSDSDPLPEALNDNWDSTFLVITETPTTITTGTSFLIHIQKKELVDELYFLTSHHVIEHGCPEIGKCPALKLTQKALLVHTDKGSYLEDLKDEAGVEYAEVEIIKKSANHDIALMKVVVPKSPKTPNPMKMAESCLGASSGKLYTIGFSDTHIRTASSYLEIDNQELTYKRWSQGIYTRRTRIQIPNQAVAFVDGTTIDALPGGSGGPVINSKGEVVGLMRASSSIEENKYAYDGNEKIGQLSPTSYAVGCAELKSFFDVNEMKSCVYK